MKKDWKKVLREREKVKSWRSKLQYRYETMCEFHNNTTV